MCLQKYLHKGKIRLKIEHFLLKIVPSEPSFCQNIDNFWLKMQNHIISVKLLVFGVKMIPQKMPFLLLKFMNNLRSSLETFLVNLLPILKKLSRNPKAQFLVKKYV